MPHRDKGGRAEPTDHPAFRSILDEADAQSMPDVGAGSMLDAESEHWRAGQSRVAGLDEAGRGPLAGPVVAAAVVLQPDFARAALDDQLAGLTDSKQLTPAKREAFYAVLRSSSSVDVGVGTADVAEINRLNILRATHLAMARALADLPRLPDHVLIDGLPVPGLPVPSTAMVKGDALSLSIAAASVVAKVVRDATMVELDRQYPAYGFGAHKGYGTARHIQALFEYGPTPEHRSEFRPVRAAADMRRRMEE